MSWTRRGVLRGLVGGAAAAGVGVPNLARANGLTSHTLNGTAYKILEIFQTGGASHRETWWHDRPEALPTWRSTPTQADWIAEVGTAGFVPTATSQLNMNCDVDLGPCSAPIHGHALYDRMRLVAVGHHIGAHRPAAFLGLTGLSMGRSRASGLAAAVQRHYGSGNNTMASYIIDASSNFAGYANYAAASGVHGSHNRPLVVPVSNGSQLMDLLDRPNSSLAQDHLLSYYDQRYGQRLTYPGGSEARSEGYSTYRSAVDRALSSQSLKAKLQAAMPGLTNPLSGYNASSHYDGQTRRGIELGARLLQDPDTHHVCVLERGRRGYDTHLTNQTTAAGLDLHAIRQGGNAWAILQSLRDMVDQGVLDLNNTLIWIHSEFGRVRNKIDQYGTNHWNEGFANVLIGGPILAGQRDVRGAMDFPLTTYTPVGGSTCDRTTSGGAVTDGGDALPPRVSTSPPSATPTAPSNLDMVRPTDMTAAVLMAAGLDPFHQDVLLTSETSVLGSPTPASARADIADAIFGTANNV